eukprot:scaffold34.g4521.t1
MHTHRQSPMPQGLDLAAGSVGAVEQQTGTTPAEAVAAQQPPEQQQASEQQQQAAEQQQLSGQQPAEPHERHAALSNAQQTADGAEVEASNVQRQAEALKLKMEPALRATLQLLGPEQMQERSMLENALRGVEQYARKAVAPQAVLLVSSPDTEWGSLISSDLAADAELAPYLDLVQRAFQHSLTRMQLEQMSADAARARAALPDLSDVQLRPGALPGLAGSSRGAPPKPKLPPPSRRMRDLLRCIWKWLLEAVLKPAGLSGHTCYHLHAADCKVVGEDGVCQATQKLIDRGDAKLEDGQLIISSAAAAQGATSCHKARAHLGLPPELPLVVYSNIDLQTKTMGPLIKFYMESDNSVLQPHRAALQEYLQRAQLPAPAGGSEVPGVADGSEAVLRAGAFAAQIAGLAEAQRAAGPATTSEPATAAPELPACCELRDGTAVVRADNPSFEELRGTVLYNRGVAGIKAGDTHFKRELEFKSGGKVVGTMLVTSLWAALRAAGGMHLVLKRGTLLQLLDSMRDASSFPRHLVKQLEGRIKTWLVPIYGYDEDEEQARVPADRLQGALAAAAEEGWLSQEGSTCVLLLNQPAREQVLLAMQANDISLPNYDLVLVGNLFVGVEVFYAAVFAEGGPDEVRVSNNKASNVAAACGVQGRERTSSAVRDSVVRAAGALATLFPQLAPAAGQDSPLPGEAAVAGQDSLLPGEAVAAAGQGSASSGPAAAAGQDSAPFGLAAAAGEGGMFALPNLALASTGGLPLLNLLDSPELAALAFTPPLAGVAAPGCTPFGTAGAAGVMAALQQPVVEEEGAERASKRSRID